MLVKNWMSQPVITVEVSDTIKLANQLLNKNRIRSLPVLSEGELVGIVTDRDLKRASISETAGLESHEIIYLNTRIELSEIMTENPITVTPETTVDEVAKILLKHKISGVPVVNDSGNLVGIITQGDIFKLLISLTGIEAEGVQIAVQIEDKAGTVKEIADIVRSLGGRIGSLLTSYDDVPDGYRNAYFKAYQVAPEKIDDLINLLKEKAKLQYVIEHLGNNQPSIVRMMEE
ncbi:CBS and ACT domain-containing protein [bacterium]|nr:CBS and ACT domain-containing protein [bacterium]